MQYFLQLLEDNAFIALATVILWQRMNHLSEQIKNGDKAREELSRRLDNSLEELNRRLDNSLEELNRRLDKVHEELNRKLDKLTDIVNTMGKETGRDIANLEGILGKRRKKAS